MTFCEVHVYHGLPIQIILGREFKILTFLTGCTPSYLTLSIKSKQWFAYEGRRKRLSYKISLYYIISKIKKYIRVLKIPWSVYSFCNLLRDLLTLRYNSSAFLHSRDKKQRASKPLWRYDKMAWLTEVSGSRPVFYFFYKLYFLRI